LSAESPFVLEDKPKFTFRGAEPDLEPVSFWLGTKAGNPVTGVKVKVMDLQDSKGRPLDTKAVSTWSPATQDQTLTAAGARVELRVQPGILKAPDTYTFRLLVESTQPASSIPVDLSVTFPPADLNVDALKDTTIELTRSAPWSTAEGTATLDLHETLGTVPILSPVPYGLALQKDGKKTIVPGTLKPTAPGSVPAGSYAHLKLAFSGLEQTGSFTTGVSIRSSSLAQEKTIPLKVAVTDAWVWPFFAIFLGVLGGWAVRFVANTFKPRRLNEYSIVHLRAEIEQDLAPITDRDKRKPLTDLLDRLRQVADENTFGDPHTAATKLAQIEQDFNQIRTQRALAMAAARAEAVGDSEGILILSPAVDQRTTDSPVTFQLNAPSLQLQAKDELRWSFGDIPGAETGGKQISHLYRDAGGYTVTVVLLRDSLQGRQWSTGLDILPGKNDRALAQVKRQLVQADAFVSLVALLLAALSGVAYWYIGKTFGSLAEYIGAILWGFGMDSSVRGFSDVLKKITTP
jgi:hypothetical protein